MREHPPFEGGIFVMGVSSSSVGALLWEVHLKHYGALMKEVTLLIVAHSSRVWLLWSRLSTPLTVMVFFQVSVVTPPFSFCYEREGSVSSCIA
jgi:hypothetical protein